ncbi:MAG: hypothetical protein IPN63_06500 [Gammaproteobacteria bacterium]|nr:hypothetical protein [Gammaproteobacteria bacterium]
MHWPEEQCVDIAGIINWHANYLGRRYGLEDLEPPLLVGHGTGAGLVYALLAQAPSLTFAGAVTDAPNAQLPFGVELCGISTAPGANGEITLNAAPISALWHVVGATPDDPLLHAIRESNPDNQPELVASSRFAKAAVRTLDALEAVHPPQSESITDLQVVELPARHPADTLAVIYSGDGGWRDLDKTIGGLLVEQGIAVIGVDAVRYFWRERSPARTAADLVRILEHYGSLWSIHRVALIGYSFGAEVLPFAYNRLPEEWQQRVVTVALLTRTHRQLRGHHLRLAGQGATTGPSRYCRNWPHSGRQGAVRIRCQRIRRESVHSARHWQHHSPRAPR